MNILLVDEEALVLEELAENVEALLPDADRFPFTKAKEALEFAAEKQMDIAFLDINMRVMDGITMAKQLQ